MLQFDNGAVPQSGVSFNVNSMSLTSCLFCKSFENWQNNVTISFKVKSDEQTRGGFFALSV